MSCDLGVDTDAIRGAATAIGEAAQQAGEPARLGRATPDLSAGTGGSAAVRESCRLAITRTEQALLGCDSLDVRARQLDSMLRLAAEKFDSAEHLCAAGF